MYELQLKEPCENGGFLVLPTEGEGGVSAASYANLYPSLIGCTFPVSGDIEVLKGLKVNPETKGAHPLVSEFGSKGFRFLFLPRTLYLLLHHVFLLRETVAPRVQSQDIKQISLVDPMLVITQKQKGSVAPYFLEVIEQLRTRLAQHNGHFNAWAVHFLSSNGFVRRAKLVDDAINGISLQGALAVLDELLKAPPPELSELAKLAAAFQAMTKLEYARPECTFLTRFASSSAGCYITDVAGFGTGKETVTATARSASFGADLFAGLFGDTHACTLTSLGGKATAFAFPIHIARFRRKEGLEGLFWIPPFPTPSQCYAPMHDLWHPRSRILVRKAKKLDQQAVGGINFDNVRNFAAGVDESIAPLAFMFYGDGTALDDDAIIKLSTEVEAFVKANSTVIWTGDSSAVGNIGMSYQSAITKKYGWLLPS